MTWMPELIGMSTPPATMKSPKKVESSPIYHGALNNGAYGCAYHLWKLIKIQKRWIFAEEILNPFLIHWSQAILGVHQNFANGWEIELNFVASAIYFGEVGIESRWIWYDFSELMLSHGRMTTIGIKYWTMRHS